MVSEKSAVVTMVRMSTAKGNGNEENGERMGRAWCESGASGPKIMERAWIA